MLDRIIARLVWCKRAARRAVETAELTALGWQLLTVSSEEFAVEEQHSDGESQRESEQDSAIVLATLVLERTITSVMGNRTQSRI